MKCKECGKEYPSDSYLKTETLCKTCYEKLRAEDQNDSAVQWPELPNPSELIKRALQNTEVRTLSGVISGSVRLTPTDVEQVGYLAKHWKPTFNDERCRVMVDTYTNAIPLVTVKWEPRSSSDKPVTTGIYEGGLKFPKFCCTCMEPAARYQLVEVGRKVHDPKAPYHEDRKKKMQIYRAIAGDRFWYAIPYCRQHDLNSGSVSIDETPIVGTRLEFLNRDFARQFCKINGLEGRWLAGATLIARSFGLYGILGGLFATTIGSISLYFKFFKSHRINPIADAFFVGGLIVFVGSLIFWIKKRKGKQV